MMTGISHVRNLALDQGYPPIESVRQILWNKTHEAKETAMITEPAVNSKPTDVSWEQKVADLERKMQEMRLYQQRAAARESNCSAGPYLFPQPGYASAPYRRPPSAVMPSGGAIQAALTEMIVVNSRVVIGAG
jgi:hypothetical protein